jgi:hypothetical protein
MRQDTKSSDLLIAAFCTTTLSAGNSLVTTFARRRTPSALETSAGIVRSPARCAAASFSGVRAATTISLPSLARPCPSPSPIPDPPPVISIVFPVSFIVGSSG